MSSTSFNSSSSSSAPVVTQTPQNALIDQLSGVAAGLAQQMNNWAQQTYAKTSQVTDQAVGNFFQASQQMAGLSSEMTGQYNNLFAPENAALVNDANSYASTDRQQVDMGQAGATQAQAGDQAIKNSEQNLVSMGIDPSSGRYAALDKAAAVQNAANVAGAENVQRNQDIQTGQNLRSQAVQVGAQLPGAISNATNTAIQANTGASNASLANANTGANLNSLADKYLQTAMNIKLPLQGQQSSGSSNGNSNSNKPSNGPGNGGGGSGNGGGGGPSQGSGPTSWSGMNPNTSAQGATDNAKASGQPGSRISNVSPYDIPANANVDPNASGTDWGTGVSTDPNGFGGTDFSQWTGGNNIYQPDSSGSSMSLGDQTSAPVDYTNSDPFANSGFGQTYDSGGGASSTFGDMSGGTNTQYGDISYDPSANQSQADWTLPTDTSMTDTSGFDSSGSGTDMSGYSSDTSGTYSGDTSGGSYDTSGDTSGGLS